MDLNLAAGANLCVQYSMCKGVKFIKDPPFKIL